MNAMRWNGWGDQIRATTLPAATLDLLLQVLGSGKAQSDPVSAAEVRLPAPMLAEGSRRQLEAIVGADHVLTTAADRIGHTGGKSTVDLLRIRSGDATGAPDAVVRPGGHDEVLAVLTTCSANRVAVVPFGGGTSVVGGLAPAASGFAGVIALDLGRMNELIELDELSRLAVFGAGMTGPEAEKALAEHGLTLGHYPQSFEYATIGGYAATRSSGQYSLGYGRFDEMVMALRIATPRGTVDVGRAPRSAAGPDLRQLFLGSEGTLGVITSVTAQVAPAPVQRQFESWTFGGFSAGLDVVRRLVQSGLRPTMIRLSDEHETGVNALLDGRAAPDGCLAVVGYEHEQAVRDHPAIADFLTAHGSRRTDDITPEAWHRSRFQAPYLRDALLDAGVLVETLETAAFWSRVPDLYSAVRDQLVAELTGLGTPPIVLCHMSHVYATGAALYFTIACAQTDDPVGQWQVTKAAVTRTVLDAGGTVTHHHGVGRDHAAGLVDEVGALALDSLRAVKDRFDPDGILNPGVLLHPHGDGSG